MSVIQSFKTPKNIVEFAECIRFLIHEHLSHVAYPNEVHEQRRSLRVQMRDEVGEELPDIEIQFRTVDELTEERQKRRQLIEDAMVGRNVADPLVMVESFATPQTPDQLRRILFMLLHEALRDHASVMDQDSHIELNFRNAHEGSILPEMHIVVMDEEEEYRYRQFLKAQPTDQGGDDEAADEGEAA